jgi:glycosyltransferase involved in cell wall biosynthesis
LKILYIVVNSIRPPLTGHDIRISSQLRVLRRISEVELFALSEKSSLEEATQNRNFGKESQELNNALATQVLRGSLKPFFYRRNQEVLDRINRNLEGREFDFVVYSGLESTSVFEDVSLMFPKAINILDLDESTYRWNQSFLNLPVSKVQQIVWKNYFPTLQKLEDSLIGAFHQVWVCSPIELETVKRRHPFHSGIRVIPNSLVISQRDTASVILGDKKTLLYVGSFTHLPNQFAVNELVREIMPLMLDFNLEVVGREVPDSWLAETSNRVKYFSNVEDLEPHYRRALAAVLPLRAGAGTRVKVLEASQFGVPVVSTAFGVEGMEFVEDRHYLRAESPEEFAKQITRLVKEPGLSDQLVQQANSLIEDKFSIEFLRNEISTALTQINDSKSSS